MVRRLESGKYTRGLTIMDNMNVAALVELSDADLDAVCGGANNNNRQQGLVNANVQNVNVLVAAQALTNSSALTPAINA